MTRKRHNTVSALLASTALLVVSLMAASPATPPVPATGLAVVALPAGADATAVRIAVLAPEATPAAVDGTAVSHGSGSAAPRRRHRQSVAMPYFSFAPQG